MRFEFSASVCLFGGGGVAAYKEVILWLLSKRGRNTKGAHTCFSLVLRKRICCGVECSGYIRLGTSRSVAGDKYETVYTDNNYNKYMMLKIKNVSAKDFGSYKCIAQNSLGSTDGVIKLDGSYIYCI